MKIKALKAVLLPIAFAVAVYLTALLEAFACWRIQGYYADKQMYDLKRFWSNAGDSYVLWIIAVAVTLLLFVSVALYRNSKRK